MDRSAVPVHGDPMLKSAVGRLRIAGILEGISFLALLGVAMPLKYLWHRPEAVSVVGLAHGILFIAFCFALLHAMLERDWPLRRGALFFLAALVPFGPFLIDPVLRREDAAPGGVRPPGALGG